MLLRSAAVALAALSLTASVAEAQKVVPLAGTGENFQPIARVELPRVNELELAGDWAFLSLDANEENQGGLAIVNIADPTKPFVESIWKADKDAGIDDFSAGDVDLSPDGNRVVLTNAHNNRTVEGQTIWAAILDVTDKKKPKLAGQIVDDETMDYVHTVNLDDNGNTLYMNPQVAAFYPQTGNAHITVFDITNPAKPVKKGTIADATSEAGMAHDSYVDHRPDGKKLLYAASISKTDVFDITSLDAMQPLQNMVNDFTISHDVQPNHDRTVLIVDDEGAAGGQLDENVSVCGKFGTGPAAVDSGSVHFFEAAPDGTFANGGLVPLGTFNAPINVATGACVAHVFWQAPNENRMTQAYYRTGGFAIDFEDPSDPKQIGFFKRRRRCHLLVLQAAPRLRLRLRPWTTASTSSSTRARAAPAGRPTAGPAEIQRVRPPGHAPTWPIKEHHGRKVAARAPGSAGWVARRATQRKLGTFRFNIKIKKVSGKKGKKSAVTVTFTDSTKKKVGSVRVKKAAAKKATVAVRGVAETGTYKWTAKIGKKTVKRGTIKVGSKSGLQLSAGAKLAVTAK